MDKYTIVLTKAFLDIVMEGLSELPLKKSMSVFNEINQQFVSQLPQAEEVTKTEEK